MLKQLTSWAVGRIQRDSKKSSNQPRYSSKLPASILYKSTAGLYPDGTTTARYRFIKNAYWALLYTHAPSLFCMRGMSQISCF